MTYILFAGNRYYPQGGIFDICGRGTVDELKLYFQEHAKEIAVNNIDNWGQIVEAETLKCVCFGTLGPINRKQLMVPGIAKWVNADDEQT